MNIFKSRKFQTNFDKSMVVVAICSLVFSMMVPKVVNAGTIDTLSNLVDMVVGENNKPTFPVAGDRFPVRIIKVVSTAYSSDVWQTDSTPCIPASGYDLCAHYEKYGEGDTIAANFLPLGTKVRIPSLYGDKVFIVRDRMNARYGYGRIDIWMPEYLEAKNFGVKRNLVMEVF